ncbi:MAG TPA: glycoside hydrolase family 76 protein [Mycobacteriales bacterium]|nr:glycoside hydrolase family 76 protein [Mycobacteriales bacterium]
MRITVVAAAAAAILSIGMSQPALGGETSTNADRAVASYTALQKYFYAADGSSLYAPTYPAPTEGNPYSYEWPFSQAHVATLDLTGIRGIGPQYADDLRDRGVGQERFWNSGGGTTGVPGYDSYPRAPYGGGGDMFYDDNEWVGMEKAQQYLQTGDRAALHRAEDIFALVVSGWDTDSSHPDPGGVFWTQATWSTDRNTVSNMPGAELGMRLYLATGKRSYLDWSRKMYEWANTYLLAPNNLYWDHVDLAGNIEKTQWSYNQGTPIGAGVLLFEATGQRKYLQQAEKTAQGSYDFYITQGHLDGQGPTFNAIYFKNLLLLESVTGGHKYRDAMQAYADRLWSDARDPATGVFHFNDTGTTDVIEQSSMIQIYATLAWPRGQARLLY